MEPDILAIFQKIPKPEGYADWTKEHQDGWLNAHFNDWFASLTPEERAKIDAFLKPKIHAHQAEVMQHVVESIRQGILLEQTAEMSTHVKFTAPQKERLRKKIHPSP